MNKTLYFIGLFFCISILLSGCTEEEWVLRSNVPGEVKPNEFFDFTVSFDESERGIYSSMPDVPSSGDMGYVENQVFPDRVEITYSDNSVQVENANPMIMVVNSGTDVEIHSFLTTGVEYVLKGKCTDGSFKVSTSNADYKITLSGLDLSNPDGAALYVLPTVVSKAFIYAEEGTVNQLRGCLDENSTEKACVKSGGDLIFCGKGSVDILSNYKHAVETKGNVFFRGGCRLKVTTAESGNIDAVEQPKDGVHAGGNVVLTGGEVDIFSVGDGIQSESGYVSLSGGFLNVVTTGEKSHAIKTAGNVDIKQGALHAWVKGNASKCISSDSGLDMSGGRVTLMSDGGTVYDEVVQDMSSCAGIKATRDIRIHGGILLISSAGEAGKGINTDGMLTIEGDSEVKIITTGKKVVMEGLDSNPKGISADAGIVMKGRVLWVNALGGTSGCDGLATKNSVAIDAGEVKLRCYDDCMNADRDITINGGTVCCYSDGNDGVDAGGKVTVNGGLVISCGTALAPDGGKGEGVDCSEFMISGGTVVALGGGDTTPSSASTQNSVLYKTDAILNSNDVFYLENEFGGFLMAFQLPGSFNSLDLMFSSAMLETGNTYKFYRGLKGMHEGDAGIFGYYTVPVCHEGTELFSFTVREPVTSVDGQ